VGVDESGERQGAGHPATLPFGPRMATRVVPAPLAQLPNALTVLRLLAIPVFVVLLLRTDGEGSYALAGLFAATALTDQVDGFLARRWHVESEFGKYADPLADRLMIDAAVLLLCLDGRLPWLALAIVLARDALLIGGYRAVRDRGYEFSVSTLGKAATWVLYAAITGVIASDQGTEWPLWLFWAGIGLAVLAAVFYVAGALRTVER
jgi:CDP-diacylglycerol--glycerol-3-phosphate 3-phosphatidyltransferase